MKRNFIKVGFILSAGMLLMQSCNKDDASPTDDNPMTMDSAQLFASNNNDGNVSIYQVATGEVTTLATTSTAAEGIYYDASTDEVIQASRSSNQLNVYGDISTILANASISASFSSSSDVESPRDLAVNGNFVVISDNTDVDGNDTTPDGRIFVYTRDSGSLTLRNIVTTDFALWGIEFVGNDLYAVVDKTNELAVFINFTATYTTNATASATKKVVVEGIVRTHGLAYDNGTMILTDVGDATSDADGGFQIITGFDAKFNATANGATLALTDQTRVAGASTFLGNPVAAEYDATSNTVFIAEAANGGGRVLSYTDADAGGDIAPNSNATLSQASSLYFYEN